MGKENKSADDQRREDEEPRVTQTPRPYVDYPRVRDDVKPDLLGDEVEVREFQIAARGVKLPPQLDWTDATSGLNTPPLVPRSGTEIRYLSADAPSSARPGEPFSVVAGITRTPSGRIWQPLGAVLLPVEGLLVTVVLAASRPVRLLTPGTQQFKVLPGTDSSVEFVLEPIDSRPLALDIRAFSEGRYLGQVSMLVEVGDKPSAARIGAIAEMEFDPTASRSATLSIERDPSGQQYEFSLALPGRSGLWASMQVGLGVDLNRVAALITGRLDAFARGAVHKDLVSNYLAGIGSRLWDGLPDPIREALERDAEQVERLTLLTRNDQLPWELMWTGSGEFLADRWSVSRWTLGRGAAPATVGDGEAQYVLPQAAPTRARQEVVDIGRVYPGPENWSTVDQLLNGITSASFGLLHIAAHNTADFQVSDGSYISLDRPFDQLLLGSHLKQPLKVRRPLVFINACGSAVQTPTWIGTSSWADLFIEAGAGAFIGSLWEIRDESASRFAQAFYEAARGGSSLGNAFAQARSTIQLASDPTRLAYTFYGHHDARLVTRGTP